MNRKCLVTAVFFLTLLHAVPAARSAEPQEADEKQEALTLLYWRMLYDRGHFILDGTVVDEAGKPIPDFFVDYSRGRSDKEIAEIDAARRSPDPAATAEVHRKQRQGPDTVRGKDGRFHIDVKNAEFYTFSLRFHASGYYDAETYMEDPLGDDEYAALEQAITNRIAAKEAVPTEILVKKKFKVMMRKKRQTTKLERALVELQVSQRGDRSGYQFALPGKNTSRLIRLKAKETKFPPRSLFLSVDRDNEGAFLIKEAGYKFDVAASAKLVLHSSSGDGFVRYEPSLPDTEDPDVKYFREPVRRGMTLAPETDYNPELILTAKELAESSSEKALKFYFKCGGRYGRGSYHSCSFSEDHLLFTVLLDLEFQPDGSRNLETGE